MILLSRVTGLGIAAFAGLLLAVSTANATTVNCTNGSADLGLLQAAVAGGGTIVVNGPCRTNPGSVNLSVAGTNLIAGSNAVITATQRGGTTLNFGNSNLTVNGIDFEGWEWYAGGALTGLTLTNNKLQNSNKGFTSSGFHNSRIANNTFHNLFFDPGYINYNPGGFPGNPDAVGPPCWQDYDGIDATVITGNSFTQCANDGFHINPNGKIHSSNGSEISYNYCSQVMRACFEIQAFADNMVVKGNVAVDYDSPNWNSFAYSIASVGNNFTFINNYGTLGHQNCRGGVADFLEDFLSPSLIQGNVSQNLPVTADCQAGVGGGSSARAWDFYTDNFGNNTTAASNTSTILNNVMCGNATSAVIGHEDGNKMRNIVDQYNYKNASSCPGTIGVSNVAAPVFTSTDNQAFPNGGNGTWTITQISTLPIKWVQFFLDGSGTPLATQELQDVNSNFPNDLKWHYHATFDTTPLAHSGHTIKVVATDVLGATSSATQSFTVGTNGGPTGPSAPTVSAFTASAGTITAGQSTTLSWTQTGGTSLSIDNGVGDVSGRTSVSVSPAQTTTYVLTVTNSAGTVTRSVTVSVNAAPPPILISSFKATPASLMGGQSAVLSWTVSGATSLSIDNGISDVSGKTSINVTPTATTTYTLTATNAGGSVTATTMITVIVVSGPAPSAPTTLTGITPDATSASLSWKDNSDNETGFLIQRRATQSADPFTTVATVGANVTTFNDTGLTNGWQYDYQILATNGGNNSAPSNKITIQVGVPQQANTPVIIVYSAAPTTIVTGGSSTLAWTQTGADSLSIDNNVGDVTGKSSISVSPTQTTIYTLSAKNGAGTVTAVSSVTVVAPQPKPTIATFSASPTSITTGQSSTLFWDVAGATALSIDNQVGDVSGKTSITVSPTETTIYTLSALNSAGTVFSTTTVTVSAPASKPTITSFKADPSTIQSGQSSTLSWAVIGASSLSIDSGVGDVTGKTSVTVSPTVSTTYTLSATDSAGTVVSVTSVTVNAVSASPAPAAPSNLAGSSPNGTSVSLLWKDNSSDETGFLVQRRATQTKGAFVTVGTVASNVTQFTDTGLNTLWEYDYQILSTNNGSNSAPSNNITVQVGVITLPGGGDTKPKITSYAALPVSITIGQSSMLSWTVTTATTLSIDNGVGDVTGRTSVSVSPSHTTTYTLTATNSAGVTVATAIVSVTPLPAEPTITSFTASPASITVGSSSSLSWDVSGATSLTIDNGVGSVTGKTSIAVSPAQTTTYTLTATNSAGTSIATALITVTAASAKPTITSFNSSPASITSGQSSTLSWTVTGATSLSIDNGVGIVTGQASTAVSPIHTTTYTLSAMNASGTVTATTLVTLTVTAPQTPPAPSGLKASASDSLVSLSWNASFGATTYNVKRSQTQGSGYQAIGSPTTTSFADHAAMDGTTYYYVVTAINTNGESSNSTEVSATPLSSGRTVDLTLPAPTLHVPPSLAASDFVSATYPAEFIVTGYEWTVTPMDGLSGAASAVTKVGSSSISLGNFGFTSGQFQVQARALVGATKLSKWGSATTQIRSAAVIVTAGTASIYPNPWRADKHLGHPITFDGLSDGSEVKIFNSAAHYVTSLTVSGSKATWDPSDAASGIYLYTVKDTQGGKTKGKFVVIR